MYSKVLGVLLGAAVGDAMGVATELRTPNEIYNTFGHWVTDFETPPDDVFAGGREAGQITDDFSSAYFTIRAILKAEGKITPQIAKAGILSWAKSEYYDTFAGPTTRAAIEEIRRAGELGPYSLLMRCGKATNGAAMKAFAGAIFQPGDLDAAADAAIAIAEVTHPFHLCLSGAAAIASAVSEAISGNATLDSIFEAGIYGAKRGERIGIERGFEIAGPSVWKRMELAKAIALGESDPIVGLREIREVIGTGIHVSESVPAVFGILYLAKGDAETGIKYAVNIGDDTDTIATMVGAILGGFNGADGWGDRYLSTIERCNELDLKALASEILLLQSGEQGMYTVFIGSNAIDEYYDCEKYPLEGEKAMVTYAGSFVGGMIANAACIYASTGEPAVMIDKLGMTEADELIMRDLALHNVHTVVINRDPSVVGYRCHIYRSKKESTIFVIMGRKANYALDDKQIAFIRGAKAVYSTPKELKLLTNIDDVLRDIRVRGITLMLDIEPASYESYKADKEILQAATIISFTETAFSKMEKEAGSGFLMELLSDDTKQVLITRGERGATLYRRGSVLERPGVKVKVVDTTGAGDTFNAIYLYGKIKGMDDREALETAIRFGATATEHMGARGRIGEIITEFQ